jgi:polyhydroxyalkanoate synthase
VLDLTPANSLVAWLRDQGFTVYMVSWRSADEEIRDFGWDDYLRLGARAALDLVHEVHGARVHVAGYCVGGALGAVLAARLAEEGDDRLASLSLLAAQTDFSEPGDLGLFIDEASLKGMEQLIAGAGGIMPGEAMRDAFNLLRPEDLIWRYVEERYLLGEPPKPFDLLYWNSDQTHLPGPLHLTSLRRLYLENALARGAFMAEGRPVSLSAISVPAFIHAARKDHISPFSSVYKGVHLMGGDVTFLLADSGHIAGVVNPPAAGKYRYWVADSLPPGHQAWMAAASEHPGSWWPVWAQWLEARSGGRTSPPPPVAGAAPAPGDYVRTGLADRSPRQDG